jgi:acyl-CoA thioester hydrolase
MAEEPQIYLDEQGRLCADVRFRVRYFETDRMGVVHHAAYVTWFEEGRSAFTRALGYPYAQMEADGVALAVAELSARYLFPARYDEEIAVATCLRELRSRELVFSYEIRRAADGRLLVTGATKLISVDAQSRVCRLPASLITRSAAVRDELSRGAQTA